MQSRAAGAFLDQAPGELALYLSSMLSTLTAIVASGNLLSTSLAPGAPPMDATRQPIEVAGDSEAVGQGDSQPVDGSNPSLQTANVDASATPDDTADGTVPVGGPTEHEHSATAQPPIVPPPSVHVDPPATSTESTTIDMRQEMSEDVQVDGEEGAFGDLSLIDLLNLEIRTTIAAKSADTNLSTPSSVSVFTRADLHRMGVRSLEELINYVPGFSSGREIEQGTSSRIASRGRSSALSESILVLIDGQRINDLYTGGTSIINRQIAIDNLKQVEIIRGPGSALYGSNAFLGVINLVTETEQSDISAVLGSTQYAALGGNFTAAVGDVKLAGFVRTVNDGGFDYKEVTDSWGNTGTTSDPWRGMDGYFSVRHKRLAVNLRHMRRNLEKYLTFGVLDNLRNKEATSQTSVSASYGVALGEKAELTFKGGAAKETWNAHAGLIPQGADLGDGNPFPETVTLGPILESLSSNVGVDFSWALHETNALSAGVLYEHAAQTKVIQQGDHDPITLESVGDLQEFGEAQRFNRLKSRDILGVYVQDRQTLGPVAITVGGRLDAYSDFGSSLNPRAALVYQTPIKSALKVMYGRAFRAPNFLELYDLNNPVDFGNPDLKPEKVDTFEAAYVQNSKYLTASATFFYNRITDIITLGDPVDSPENPLGAPAFANQGTESFPGFEVELRAAPLKSLLVMGNYTFTSGDDNRTVPRHMASLTASYTLGPVRASLYGYYRDSLPRIQDQDAYVVANAGLEYILTPRLSVAVHGRNLSGTTYRTLTSVLPMGVQNRGREFLALVRWTPAAINATK